MWRYLVRTLLAAFLLLGQPAVPPRAADASPSISYTVFVAPAGSDDNDCRSATTPCRTIQAGIDRAGSGGEVVVAAGVYAEHLSIGADVTIVGAGFSDSVVSGSDTGRVVTVAGGARAVLQGLAIRDGRTTEQGGGIRNDGVTVVDGCLITGNGAGSGGGIANYGTLTVVDSQISSNFATSYDGGGILNFGTAEIDGSLVARNHCPYYGGGIANYGRLTVRETSIGTNLTWEDGSGGGIFSLGAFAPADTTLVNVTISNNEAPTGTGVANLLASLAITNSTIHIIRRSGIAGMGFSR